MNGRQSGKCWNITPQGITIEITVKDSRESCARSDIPHMERATNEERHDLELHKKNTEGRYHRHRREVWTAIQCEGRDDFNDASCAEHFTQPRLPEGTVHLIIGDSLVRVLAKIQAHWQVGILSFSGAAIPPNVGLSGDAGDEKKTYGHLDDGNKRRL